LLPNALTDGLNATFSSKKDDEVKSSVDLQKRFTHGTLKTLTLIEEIGTVTGI